MIIEVPESEWEDSKYRTKEWEQSVTIKKWTHDYEAKIYIIEIDDE